MYRFSLLLALGLFVGCRMAGSQYDYCVPAYTSHQEDFRGCDPMYRAGSIFYNNADSVDSDGDVDFMQNAGNFGETTPVDKNKPTRAFGSRKPKSSGKPRADSSYNVEDLLPDKSPIGIPSSVPGPNGEEIEQPFNEQIPTLPGPASAPFGVPTTSAFGSKSLENRLNSETGLNITVEELRRLDPTLDPSVTDVRILNVEDRIK